MRGFGERRGWLAGRTWLAALLILRVVLLGLLAATHTPAYAGDAEDHDRARQALEAGEILPLAKVLAMVNADSPGRVLEVELDRRHERWVYEIKLLRQGGSVVKLWVDASDGTVIERRGRGEWDGR